MIDPAKRKLKVLFLADTIRKMPNRNIYQKPMMLTRFFETEICLKHPPEDEIYFLDRVTGIKIFQDKYLPKDSVNTGSGISQKFKKLKYIHWLVKNFIQFRKEKGKAVYTSWSIKDLFYGYLARKIGLIWIADIWDDPEKLMSQNTNNKLSAFKYAWHRRTVGFLLSKADLIVSKMPEIVIGRYGVNQKKVIAHINGVDFNELEKAGYQHRIKTEMNSPIIIVYTGPVEYYRLCYFPAIVEELNKRDLEFQFKLIGPWHLRRDIEWFEAECQRLGLTNVDYQGEKTFRETVMGIMESDICICPYPTDRADIANTYPIKIFEYMALAKPVVMFNLPKMTSILSNGEDAILVENGDIKAFADEILHLANNRAFRESLVKKAREKARQFEWRNITDSIGQELVNRLAGMAAGK